MSPSRSSSVEHRERKCREADETYRAICDFFRQNHRVPTQKELSEMMQVTTYQIGFRIAWLRGQGRIAPGGNVPMEYVQEERSA